MFASAFDFKSVDFLAELDVPAYKISSGDLKSLPFLTYIARLRKPMLVSTGGASIEDVQRAYDTIMALNRRVCLLQCTASYPAEAQYLNLRVITAYRERFPDVVIGLSDHHEGVTPAVVAYGLGARVIEKHFTLSRAWKGRDHVFALEPGPLRRLIEELRLARAALGDGVKRPFDCEREALFKLGKKLVAARELPPGHVLAEADIAMKSPGDGLAPSEIERIVGRVTLRHLTIDENIAFEDLGQRKG